MGEMFKVLLRLLPELMKAMSATSAPIPTTETVRVTKGPSDAIRQLQALINKFDPPTPRLAEDGWLGPKTEAAIASAVAKLRPFLG